MSPQELNSYRFGHGVESSDEMLEAVIKEPVEFVRECADKAEKAFKAEA